MLFPYEKYINVLIARGYPNVDISTRLTSLGFPSMESDILDKKRQQLALLLPQEGLDIQAEDQTSLIERIGKLEPALRSLGYGDMIDTMSGRKNVTWENVLYVMLDKNIRAAVLCSMVLGETLDEIYAKLLRSFKLELPDGTLQMLEKYLWNVKALSKAELVTLIMQFDGGRMRNVLMEALHNKKSLVELRTLGDSDIQFEAILKDVMQEAYLKFKDSIEARDMDGMQLSMRWAELAMKAGDRYKRNTKTDSKTALQNLLFSIKTHQQTSTPTRDKVDVI